MPDPTAPAHLAAPPSAAAEPGLRRARHRAGSQPPAPPVGTLWPLAALVVVGLSGARTLRGVPLPDDGALPTTAADLLRGTSGLPLLSPDGVAAVHTAVYATVTRAFERHATLAGAGRELLLVVLLGSAVLLWRTARRAGLGNPAGAAAVLAFGAVPALAPAHAVSTPAALGVGWLLVGAWLVAGGRLARRPWPVAAAAALGVLLVPDVLLLGVAGLAAAVATGGLLAGQPVARRIGAGAALAGLLLAVRLLVARWDPEPDDPGRWAAADADLLMAAAALLAVALLAAVLLPPLRTAAIALAATTLLAVVPPSGRLPALLLCLPVAALLLAAVLERAVGAAVAGRPARRRGARLLAAAAVAVVAAVAVTTLGTTPRSDLGATAHRQLLEWADDQPPQGGRLSAGPTLRAELLHAGADPAKVAGSVDVQVAATVPEPVLVEVATDGSPAGGAAVARFDPADGLPAVTVLQPRPRTPDPAAVDRRRGLARALLANPETVAPGPVAAVLSAGEIDPRLLSLLAGIGAQLGVTLDSLPVVPGEEGRTLVRQVVIAGIDGAALTDDPGRTDRLVAWVEAQRGPYAPDTVRPVDRGLLVTYRYSPDPDGAVARAGGR